jgi:hypothetical protein
MCHQTDQQFGDFVNTGNKTGKNYHRNYYQHRRFQQLLTVGPGATTQFRNCISTKAPDTPGH